MKESYECANLFGDVRRVQTQIFTLQNGSPACLVPNNNDFNSNDDGNKYSVGKVTRGKKGKGGMIGDTVARGNISFRLPSCY